MRKLNRSYKGKTGTSRILFIILAAVAFVCSLVAIYIGVINIYPDLKLTRTAVTPAQTPGEQTQPLESGLTVVYGNLRKNEGSPPPGFQSGSWWYYDVIIKNDSNVRVAIEKRQKKLSTTDWYKAELEKTDIIDMFGTDIVDAGASIISKPDTQWVWFYTWTYPYTLTETFYGKDAIGQEVKISYSFEVISD